jgi:hypothetical protein
MSGIENGHGRIRDRIRDPMDQNEFTSPSDDIYWRHYEQERSPRWLLLKRLKKKSEVIPVAGL